MVKEEFVSELQWFTDYYKYDMLKEQSHIWFMLSKEYTQRDFHQALIEHIRTDEFPTFPAYGKIYQQLIKIKRPIQ